MFREQKRYGNDPNLVRRSRTKFSEPLKWSEPRKIFSCSWSDWFIEEADPWRDEAWDIIRRTPQHTYQILTKRPENMKSRLPKDWGRGYPNVWLGVTAENQEAANKRIPLLLEVYANVRFVSVEPMLGPIDMTLAEYGPSPRGMNCFGFTDGFGYEAGIQWVIAGCESGSDRITDADWLRDLRDQCTGLIDIELPGVPFFLKQMMIDGKLVKEPFLDGRQWLEFPKSE
jgi:protein gp37